jgi:hypothetical protein
VAMAATAVGGTDTAVAGTKETVPVSKPARAPGDYNPNSTQGLRYSGAEISTAPSKTLTVM